MLTIGPRFGGAVDDAARYFKDAYDKVKLRWAIYVKSLNTDTFKVMLLTLTSYPSALFHQNLTPYEFVESMKKKGIRVPGIGHRY